MILQLQCYQLEDRQLEIFVPDAKQIQEFYEQRKNREIDFPYWSQVWPAAVALSEFIIANPIYVKDKTVLELAAGLGLPSVVAAKWAKDICCSDYDATAVAVVEKTIAHHQLYNMRAAKLQWQNLPDKIPVDTLLLSDVNYNPEDFEALFEMIQQFINNGTCVLLSTPQRLLAKPFIEKLLPWCVRQEEREVNLTSQTTNVCIMVLMESNNPLTLE
jgi:predicted nicotinamide N-methyase